MPRNDHDKWDSIYQSSGHISTAAAPVLTENMHLLPATGRALDLASGTGVNALQLARAGLQVDAWDISAVALEKLAAEAGAAKLHVSTEQRDIIMYPPPPDSYDVILVSHFLERTLTPYIIRALRTGGLLFYQTWTRNKPENIGPANPDYLLARNELLVLFNQLAVVVYREETDIGELSCGYRHKAMLIAQKRQAKWSI